MTGSAITLAARFSDALARRDLQLPNRAVSNLRVLHVIPSIAPRRGGPSHAVTDMVNALNATPDFDARILTTNDDAESCLPVTCGQWCEYGGAPVWFLPRFSPRVKTVREYAYSAQLRAWLARHAHDYDLLHVHAMFSYLPSFAMAHARRHRLPYVLRPIGQLSHWSLAQSAIKKRAYLALLERRNLRHAACLHFTSELEREEARPLTRGVPDAVIPLGVREVPLPTHPRQALVARFDLDADASIVLSLGRLHPKKGLEYLLPALALADSDTQLLIAGSGTVDYENQLRAQAHALGLESRVRWLGFVDGAYKQQLLAGADMLALTSHSENFGMAVVEALAMGTPVLVTRGVALAPFVDEHGLGQVCELDVAHIARGLCNHASLTKVTPALRRQVTLDAFGWGNVARQVASMYARLVK